MSALLIIDDGCQLAAGFHTSPGAHFGGDVTIVSSIPSGTLAVGVPERIREHP